MEMEIEREWALLGKSKQNETEILDFKKEA